MENDVAQERISTEADGPGTVNERLSTSGPGPEGQPDTVTERLSGSQDEPKPDETQPEPVEDVESDKPAPVKKTAAKKKP